MQFEIYTLMLALLKVTGNSELGKYVWLNHGCPNLFLEGHCPGEFGSNPN